MDRLSSIFKAYDVRGVCPDPLGEAEAWRIGYAAGRFLKKNAAPINDLAMSDTVLVSRDMRPSSSALTGALIEGLRAGGVNVIDLGLCDTSLIYFAVNHLGAAGGIQTTASHNPVQYNGFKISGYQARPIGSDSGLCQIQAEAASVAEAGSIKPTGKLETRQVWDDYRRHILRFFKPPAQDKRPLKVVVDASNGMAGKMFPAVFDRCEGVQWVRLNFAFGPEVPFAHEPNPLVAENMVPTQESVKAHGASLGVCFDGDADRCMITDELGQIVGCDHLTALLVKHFLETTDVAAGSNTIVYDLRSSKVVEETVNELNATPRRQRVGHVFMKAALRETKGVFGGELSGHFYFRDNFYADSGAITLASVLWLLGHTNKTMSELVAPYRKYPQSGEINFKVEDKDAVLQSLKKEFAGAQIDTLDGVTIDLWDTNGFWFNARPSNTEPLLRLNAEAQDRPTLGRLMDRIRPMLGEPVEGH